MKITKKQKVEGYKAFIKHVGIDETALFLYHQQKAIDGLSRNNESFMRAYRTPKKEEGKV